MGAPKMERAKYSVSMPAEVHAIINVKAGNNQDILKFIDIFSLKL